MAGLLLGGGALVLGALGIVNAAVFTSQDEPRFRFDPNAKRDKERFDARQRARERERSGKQAPPDEDPEPSFEERFSGGKTSPSPAPQAPTASQASQAPQAPTTAGSGVGAPTSTPTGEKHTEAPAPQQDPSPRVTQQIKRPQPGEVIGMVDTRVTSNNVRLVQLARANYIQEVNKYNTSF